MLKLSTICTRPGFLRYHSGQLMDSIVDESRRLQEHYSRLTDEELEALANDALDLTDAAQQALRAEISSRRLKIESRTEPPPAEAEEAAGEIDPDSVGFVSLTRVWDLNEARQVMSALRTHNVPAYLGPDRLEDAAAFVGSFDDGVDISVRDSDQPRALSVLGQALPAAANEAEPDEAGAAGARCPECHSSDVVFEGLDDASAPEGFATSKFNWSCDACGHQWKDDGVEDEG